MPEIECTRIPGGKKFIRFAPTPIMSTYLLAFVVGEFDFVQVRWPTLHCRVDSLYMI